MKETFYILANILRYIQCGHDKERSHLLMWLVMINSVNNMSEWFSDFSIFNEVYLLTALFAFHLCGSVLLSVSTESVSWTTWVSASIAFFPDTLTGHLRRWWSLACTEIWRRGSRQLAFSIVVTRVPLAANTASFISLIQKILYSDERTCWPCHFTPPASLPLLSVWS